MKSNSKYIAAALMSLLSFNAYSVGFKDAKLSGLVAIVPSLANKDVDSVPGSNQLDDSAYQFQVNYTWPSANKSPFGIKEYEYLSARAFKFIDSYTEGGVDGATELEGFAFFYGQRYMMTKDAYEGAGLGWYAGVAIGSDTWIESGYSTPQDDSLFAPLAAAEAFYKHNFNKQFYAEASFLVAVDKELGGISFVPSIVAGIEF